MRKEIEPSASCTAETEKARALKKLSSLATRAALLQLLLDRLSSFIQQDHVSPHDLVDIQQKVFALKTFEPGFIATTLCHSNGLLKSKEEIVNSDVLSHLEKKASIVKKAYKAAFSAFIRTYTPQFLLFLNAFQIEVKHVFEEMLCYPEEANNHLNRYYTLKFSDFSEQKDDDIEELILRIQMNYEVKKRKINPDASALATYSLHADTQKKSGFTVPIESRQSKFS